MKTTHRPTTAKRSGISLIQMVAVAGMLSIFLGLIGIVLFRLTRQESVMRQRTEQSASWVRLVNEFRRDVHQARTAKLDGADGQRLVLTLPEETVTWIASGSRANRHVSTTAKPELGPARESFGLKTTSLRFDLREQSDRRPEAILVVTDDTTASTAPRPSTGQVVASVGFAHRFERPAAR